MAGRVLNAAVGKSILLVGLTLCAFLRSTPQAGTAEPEAGDGLSPEQRTAWEKEREEKLAELDRELTEGPTDDRMSDQMKASIGKHGPILPMVRYRRMRPFVPEKVGAFLLRGLVIPSAPLGFSTLDSYYEGEVEGKKLSVRVTICDNRQADGARDGLRMEGMLESARAEHGSIKMEKLTVGQCTIYIQPNNIFCAIAGRFSVFIFARDTIDMSARFDRSIAQQFLDAIDLEKLSKTN